MKDIRQFTIYIIGILAIVILIYSSLKETEASTQLYQKDIAHNIIRFHVIANSDSDIDQALKLKVKDAVVEAMRPKLAKAQSKEEAEQILEKNKENVEQLADEIMQEEGYSYKSHAELGITTFPIKQYGDLTFPAGEYKAFRILIGNAKGKNWWCVMFPTLCYVDETYDVITDENKEKFKEILTEEEYESISEQEGQFFYKSKLAEWFYNIRG